MYRKTRKDFVALKLMNKSELEQEVMRAVREYIEVQQYIKKVEDDLEELYECKAITYFEKKTMLPKVDMYIDNLRNIEGYIRQACKRLGIPAEEAKNLKKKEIKPVVFKRKKKSIIQF